MSATSFQELFSLLDSEELSPEQTVGNQGRSDCPLCRQPQSLSFSVDDGQPLFQCSTGCDPREVAGWLPLDSSPGDPLAHVPDELKQEPRWIHWKLLPRKEGKDTKVPVSPNGRQADAHNPSHWMTYEDAQEAFHDGKHSGLGFVFTESDELAGVDLDNCRDPQTGELAQWALEIIERLDSYTEISPSGTGVKVWIKTDEGFGGKKLEAPNGGAVEVYTQGRYFTVTGEKLSTCPAEVRDAELAWLLEEYGQPSPGQPTASTSYEGPAPGILPKPQSPSGLSKMDRVRAYIDKAEPAISGQNGHSKTFGVACRVIHGFDLSETEGQEALRYYSERCEPPWTEREIRHKVQQALQADGPRGLLLAEEPGGELFSFNGTSRDFEARLQEPRSFAGVLAADLSEAAEERPEWLVENVFAIDQPTIFGAASKTCKTTLLVDLATSLASGMPWLGFYNVPRQFRVLFITGESTSRAIAKRLKRSLDSKGLDLESCGDWLRVEVDNFPWLASVGDRSVITREVEKYGFEVVILDPLYRGMQGLDSNKMTEQAGAIVEFTKACQPASVIISHHTTKEAARRMGAPKLEDMSGAGLAESCGNWWLMGRNDPYQFDGMHDLAVNYGGRDEQSGNIQVLFNEREWSYEVRSGHNAEMARADRKRQKQADERDERQRLAEARVRHVLANQKKPVPKKFIEDRAGECSQKAMRTAISEMLTRGELVQDGYQDSNNRTRQGGVILAKYSSLVNRISLVNETGNEVDEVA